MKNYESLNKKLNEYTDKELKALKKWGFSEINEWNKFIQLVVDEILRRKENKWKIK